MTDLPVARSVLRAPVPGAADDSLILTYDARFLRRKRLVTAGGLALLVDLAETTSLNHGDVLELADGRRVAVVAASEPLLEIMAEQGGAALHRLAWHIGNRHTPCEIAADRLLIRRDHVLQDMLVRLGAHIHLVDAPFRPEGGAYGHGRTLGHDHAGHDHGLQDHAPDPSAGVQRLADDVAGHRHPHAHGVHHHVSHHPGDEDEADGDPA